ncbi:hypothetical protein Tco_0158353 [Tanacetum coccineum]
MKKSSESVRKGKHDQNSNSEGNTYFREALVVVGNDEMTQLVCSRVKKNFDFIGYSWKRGLYCEDANGRIMVIKGVHGVQVDKRVLFEVELQGAQGNREAEVFQVSNDDAVVAQRRLEDKQLEEKTNTDCLVKEQEKVHLSIKVEANIMVIEVRSQEGVEGNVAENKKVKEYMKANREKLLKYNAWSTRWSPVQGSNTRKL